MYIFETSEREISSYFVPNFLRLFKIKKSIKTIGKNKEKFHSNTIITQKFFEGTYQNRQKNIYEKQKIVLIKDKAVKSSN